MNPLVSICVPNYNYERFIGETIESVLRQTYGNFELIIVDNCSTDNSIKIIKSYDDKRIRFYQNHENINIYKNVNKALSLANGELVAVLHSDDFYELNFLEEVVKTYKKYPDKKVFVTGAYNYHHEKKYSKHQIPFDTEGIITKEEVFIRLQPINIVGNGVNVVLHKECIANLGGYSDKFRYPSDYEYWLRLSTKYDFVSIPKLLAYYRIHDSNTSHRVNLNLDMFKEGYEIFNLPYLEKYSTKNLIRFLRIAPVFEKSLRMGLVYKSGDLTRRMLLTILNYFPEAILNPYWTISYLLSFLTDNVETEEYTKFLLKFYRIILYPHKVLTKLLVNYTIDNQEKILSG
ncbi:MAG: glycosyltransferase [Candidatus Gastranaerophilales bacterium]|nr:glycosyltransferase [Candidatus Gastranaerophilales bacterium]